MTELEKVSAVLSTINGLTEVLTKSIQLLHAIEAHSEIKQKLYTEISELKQAINESQILFEAHTKTTIRKGCEL